ncbi:hypothetical protein B566_EDAN006809 [Ephemera danica]|nr:hypothetical protein B566_EDAN006809 [Ephemera danica]
MISFPDLHYFLLELLPKEVLSSAAEEMRHTLVQRLVLLQHSNHTAGGNSLQPNEDLYEAPESFTEPDCYEEFPEVCSPTLHKDAASMPAMSVVESDSGSESGYIPALPAEAMTANAMKTTASKHGQLFRKDRFILFEQFRRSWAAVRSHYLFLFNSDKDTKPSVYHLLLGYEARPLANKDISKKGICFELVAPGRKTHQFIARTEKDMQQWIVAINAEAGSSVHPASPSEMLAKLDEAENPELRPKTEKRTRRLPSLPVDDSEMYNEAIGASTLDEDAASSASDVYEPMQDEDEDHYDDIGDYMHKTESSGHEKPQDYYNMQATSVEVPPPPSVVSTAPRPLPKLPVQSQAQPQHEDDEDFYDDVMVESPAPPLPQAGGNVQTSRPPISSFQSNRLPTPPSQTAKPAKSASLTKPNLPPAHAIKANTPIASSLMKIKAAEENKEPQSALMLWRDKDRSNDSSPNKANVNKPNLQTKPAAPPQWQKPSLKTTPKPPSPVIKQNSHGSFAPRDTGSKIFVKPEQTKGAGPNRGNIKNLIKQMEGKQVSIEPAVVSVPVNNNRPPAFGRQSSTQDEQEEDFYEPVDDESPQLPPRPRAMH